MDNMPSRKSKELTIPDIFNFLWNNVGVSVSGALCALLLLAAGGLIIHTAKGIQGRSCQSGHNWLNEDSYAKQAGCFIYRFLNLLNDDFDTTGVAPQPTGNVVAPPAPQPQADPQLPDPSLNPILP